MQTLPRPKGRATHVVITEYDLPRKTIAPHDVRTDATAMSGIRISSRIFWANSIPRPARIGNIRSRCRSRTFPTGTLDLEPDADGNLWLAMMFQTGLARFDMKTKTFQIFPLPGRSRRRRHAAIDGDAARASNVDGKVWTNDVARQSIMRLDLKTGQYERIDPFSSCSAKATACALRHGRGRGRTISISWISAARMSAASMPRPARRRSFRRRRRNPGRAGPCSTIEGRLWFTEFAANKLAMFDIRTEAFKEWDVPTPHTYPYDVFTRQQRRVVERRHGERPRAALRSAKRPLGRISVAAPDQYPARLRRQLDQSGDILGRQQSRRGNFAAAAAGLDLEGGHSMNRQAVLSAWPRGASFSPPQRQLAARRQQAATSACGACSLYDDDGRHDEHAGAAASRQARLGRPAREIGRLPPMRWRNPPDFRRHRQGPADVSRLSGRRSGRRGAEAAAGRRRSRHQAA